MKMIDGHSHILPCVDDGSTSLEYSIKMLHAAQESNISHIICTPHIKRKYGDINLQKEMFIQLNESAHNIGIKLAMGWEVNWKSLLDIGFENARNYKLGNSELFLLEFSSNHVPSNWETIVYKLQGEGLTVVIAHPERYLDTINDYSLIDSFKEFGCILMTSGNYMNKQFLGRGKLIYKNVKKMLKDGYVDIIATDAHYVDSYELFNKGLKYAIKHGYSMKKANNILKEVF